MHSQTRINDDGCGNAMNHHGRDDDDDKLLNLNQTSAGKPPRNDSAIRHCISHAILAAAADPVSEFTCSCLCKGVQHFCVLYRKIQASD